MIDIKQAADLGLEAEIRAWCRTNNVRRVRIEAIHLMHYACRIDQLTSVRAHHAAGAEPNEVSKKNRTANDEANSYGEYRMGAYTEQSRDIVAFLESVGGRPATARDIPFWRRDLFSFLRKGGA